MTALPDRWRSKTLKELCLPITKRDPAEIGRAKIRYIDIGSVDGTSHSLVNVPEIHAVGAPSRCRQIVKGGDTVFSTVRPYLEKIAFVEEVYDDQFASTGFAVLRPGPDLLPKYLFYYSISRGMLDQVLPFQKGVSYPAVRDKEVRAAAVPVPPLEEQHRIIELLEDHLSRLDAAETGLRNAGMRLRALERSALDACFGVNDDGVQLREIVESISAGKSFGSTNAPALDEEWGIVKVSAMTWGEFRPAENKAVTGDRVDPRYEIREGDLLVSRANTSEYVGASVLVGPVRRRLLLSDKSLRLQPGPGVNPEWLWRALQAPSARSQISALATGTKDSMRNISQGSLLKVRVPYADSAAQAAALRRFGEITLASGPTRSALTAARRRSTALRRSLLAAAFSGRLTRVEPEFEVA